MKNKETTLSDILNKLDKLGWTELIDSRWKELVIYDIKENFPDVSDELIEKVLKFVLV